MVVLGDGAGDHHAAGGGGGVYGGDSAVPYNGGHIIEDNSKTIMTTLINIPL